MDQHVSRWAVERTKQYVELSQQTRVLEVGSRVANDQHSIQPANVIRPNVGEYIGMDMREGDNVDIVADGKDIPFKDNSFDLVLNLETLEHVDWPRDMVRECARVLKPGGYLILTTVFSFIIHAHPDDYWRFTPSCLKMLLEDANLEVVYSEPEQKLHSNPMSVKIVGRKPQ